MDKEDVVHIYITEYHSAIKRNEMESSAVMWMNQEPAMQSGASQEEKEQTRILKQIKNKYVLMRICGI